MNPDRGWVPLAVCDRGCFILPCLLARCPLPEAGLAKFNARQGHISRKDSPKDRTDVYVYGKWARGSN